MLVLKYRVFQNETHDILYIRYRKENSNVTKDRFHDVVKRLNSQNVWVIVTTPFEIKTKYDHTYFPRVGQPVKVTA